MSFSVVKAVLDNSLLHAELFIDAVIKFVELSPSRITLLYVVF